MNAGRSFSKWTKFSESKPLITGHRTPITHSKTMHLNLATNLGSDDQQRKPFDLSVDESIIRSIIKITI